MTYIIVRARWLGRMCDCLVQYSGFYDPATSFIGHEIISTAILSLPLSRVWQLSITGEKMCTKGFDFLGGGGVCVVVGGVFFLG